MAGDAALVSRSIVCPQCHADAVLTYAARPDASTSANVRSIVYVCPNLCALSRHQLIRLLPDDR